MIFPKSQNKQSREVVRYGIIKRLEMGEVLVGTQPIKVGIILPTYNERQVIAGILKELPVTHRRNGHTFTFERIVVDDGSHDDTHQQASSVKGVTVLKHMVNMGAGAATRTGLKYAHRIDCDLAVCMDADGQHAVKDVLRMITYMAEHSEVDLLIGSRLASSGNMPLYKKVGNKGLSYLTFLLLGAYVSDSQSGLRAFSRRALKELDYHTNGYAFCSEMIWRAKRAALQIAEHPIEAIYTEYSRRDDRGQKTFSAGLKILQQLISRRIMDLLHE